MGMPLTGHAADCVVSYRALLSCLALAWYVNGCLVLAGYVNGCLALAGYVNGCLALAGYVNGCLALAGYVNRCLALAWCCPDRRAERGNLIKDNSCYDSV